MWSGCAERQFCKWETRLRGIRSSTFAWYVLVLQPRGGEKKGHGASGDLVLIVQMLTGEQARAIEPGDPYYPSALSNLSLIGNDLGLPASLSHSKSDRGQADGRSEAAGSRRHAIDTRAATPRDHGPFYCYIPQVDLMYLFTFNFGLDEFGYFAEQVCLSWKRRRGVGTSRCADAVGALCPRAIPPRGSDRANRQTNPRPHASRPWAQELRA